MDEFNGAVAVITGAASGIGRALAHRCAQEGMIVVLADLEEEALARTEEELKTAGTVTLAVTTDVSKFSDVERLAAKTLDTFGSVDLLFNNAGVGGSGDSIWDIPLTDWEWVLDVNLWGVIHGIKAFVPQMIAQESEGHIVNTASVAGLCYLGVGAPYAVSKYGIVAISETLSCELVRADAGIGVSVLCPSLVRTRFLDSDRNRAARYGGPSVAAPMSAADDDARWAELSTYWSHLGPTIEPAEVADITFDGIRAKQFYILMQHQILDSVRTRAEDIQVGRMPTTTGA